MPSPATTRPARRASLWGALLVVALPLLTPGCALFEEQVDFRTYELRQIDYPEAVELVRSVTLQFCTERFGGIGVTWDPETRNLSVDDIYEGNRKLKLYVHIEPADDGANVELLALVHTLQSGTAIWGHPQQDLTLEQMLYDAYLAAWLDQRSEV